MEKEDKRLYEAFLNGDENAFEQLVKKYKNNILYYVFSIINNKETAEDICQDVFVYIYDKKELYNLKCSFKGYLYLIAKSKSIDYLRKEKVRNEYFDKNAFNEIENVLLEDVVFENQIDENILDVLNSLKSEYREVIYLSVLEELSYSEMAKIMNKDISQIKNLVHRAKKSLKKKLIDNNIVEEKDYRIIKIVSFVIIGIIMISGIGYCTYQLINNVLLKPRDTLLGVEFSDDYEKYNVKYNEIEIVAEDKIYEENKVKLISSFLDECFLSLEFEVDLNKETYEKLRIGESVLTKKDMENLLDKMDFVDEEAKNIKVKELLNNSGKNTVKLALNVLDDNRKRSDRLIIDDKDYYFSTALVETNLLNKYTYQVYVIYPLMRVNELKDKNSFKLNINNIAICNGADISQSKEREDGMYLISGSDNYNYVICDTQIELNLSKDDLKNDSKIINNNNSKSIYKNYTKILEEVVISPVQTTVKINTIVTDVSYKMLMSGDSNNKNAFGILYYELYDQDGNQINAYIAEVKRRVKYKNGKEEDWYPGDIGTFNNFIGATFYLQDYIVFKTNNNIKSIIIKPYKTTNSSRNGNREYFDDIVINLE